MARPKSDEANPQHEDAAAGGDQVQSQADQDRERGYRGDISNPDGDAYALTSGPASPSALDAEIVAAEARLAELKAQKS